jgi:phenylalanine-4-hydroxylase
MDLLVSQRWTDYSMAEHATWDLLYARQAEVLRTRAAPEVLAGLERLRLGAGGIPDFNELSAELRQLTGWQVRAVEGLVPEEVFFRHLANRVFVAGRFIRRPDQLDYLEAPDVFHDVFGHVPLLTHPVFADYMQAYGEGGLRSMRFGSLHKLARLYWYTVEFGLLQTAQGLRIYGAGITSSHAESRYAIDDPRPNRLAFDLPRVLQTRYRIDDFQQTYFVIDSFESLLQQTLHTDFGPLYEALTEAPEHPPEALLGSDRVIHRGSGAAAFQRAM